MKDSISSVDVSNADAIRVSVLVRNFSIKSPLLPRLLIE